MLFKTVFNLNLLLYQNGQIIYSFKNLKDIQKTLKNFQYTYGNSVGINKECFTKKVTVYFWNSFYFGACCNVLLRFIIKLSCINIT